MITKPMLAGRCTNWSQIQYPVLATPKLDGIRCLKVNGQAVSRTFKPIPNRFIREEIEKNLPDGVDGELMIPGKPFGEATGIIMSSKNAEPVKFEYWVFDYVPDGLTGLSYKVRVDALADIYTPDFVIKILPVEIHNQKELEVFEEKCLTNGYEGVMIRTPNSPYKCGRSTEREGYLLKIKRFEDSEAKVIGFEEKMHNANEAKKDAFGRTERSSHKENMVPAGTLGNLIVKDLKTDCVFGIGTGLDDATRRTIWDDKQSYLGKIIKYKHQPFGAKDAPRFPVFLGFRSPDDM